MTIAEFFKDKINWKLVDFLHQHCRRAQKHNKVLNMFVILEIMDSPYLIYNINIRDYIENHPVELLENWYTKDRIHYTINGPDSELCQKVINGSQKLFNTFESKNLWAIQCP